MTFQFIPKSGKIIVTDSAKKIIKLASGSVVIGVLKNWILEAQEGEYFEGEDFEIICLESK